MTPRQTTLASLAEKFGQSLLDNTVREGGRLILPREERRERLKKIARMMDRLSRLPDSQTWHQHAAKLHRQICTTIRSERFRHPSVSLWATA
jgi:hypothetical protein